MTRIRLLVVVLALGVAAHAAVQGAIWTTDSTGTTVNKNIYSAKTDVYLSGGPQNMHSPGLRPDGLYYMQVTDPSGKTLLSTDNAVCRMVVVSGGRITAVAPASQSAGCAHATGTANSMTGTLPVQLAPFADTPNPGCEYKAWLILASAATVGSDKKHLSFSNSNSKTDNFKVCSSPVPTPPPTTSTITGVKFYDANGNGVLDAGEEFIAGIKIQLSGAATSDTTTDSSGVFTFLNLNAGKYAACEVLPYASSQWFYTHEIKWVNTTPITSGTITLPDNSTAVAFGNVCLGGLGAKSRFWWADASRGGKVFTSGDLALLNTLNLRDLNGAVVTFSSYSQYATWSNNSTTTNWAYKLSVQLAALALSVKHGFVGGGDLIYAPYAKTANSAGLISATALIAEAKSIISTDVCGSTCFISSTSSNVSYVFHIENHLDKADIDRNWVQKHACPVLYTGKETACAK